MVEIVPKPAKETPKWYKTFFYLSLALLIVVVLSYFILDYFERKSSLTIQKLEESLGELTTFEEKTLEKEVLSYQKKIDDFSSLLSEHQKSSNFFEALESFTHPQTWINELQLNLETNEARITGQVKDFRVLGQQLFILQNQNLIQNVNLSSLAIGEEGNVDFTFILSLDSQIFK